MEREQRPQSPGLKWRKRKKAPDVPYWFASKQAVAEGYPVKSVNLNSYVGRPDVLVTRCERLQNEMNLWLRRREMPAKRFDGTFKFLLENYQKHPKSPFNTDLKPGTQKSYLVYIRKMIRTIGPDLIARTDGCDIMDRFEEWCAGKDGKRQLGAGNMAIAALKSAVSFGIVCRFEGVKEFQDVLSELEFEKPKSRTWAPDASQIIAARNAAHQNGAHRRALIYALQFETQGRQWDWLGIWGPVSDPGISAVVSRGMKWFGVMWSDIDENLILTIKPSKTEDTSGVETSFDLSVCPMVKEEIDLIPESERNGPLIIDEETGLPYVYNDFHEGWRADYDLAGLPKGLWNRDTRAGGNSEAQLAGTMKADRTKVAGQVKDETNDIYERKEASLAAHRRLMAARVPFREKNKR